MKPDKHDLWGPLGGAILAAGLFPIAWWYLSGSAAHFDAATPAFHDTSPLEQWLAFSTAVAIKPVYLLLSLVLIIWLWRRKASDLVALRRGLIAFWLGENACSVNFLIYHGNGELWEYLHNFGMTVAFSFITYAVLEGVDQRLIKYSAAKDRCAALGLCRACIKYADVPCGFRRVFTLLIPATLVLALMPLCAGLREVAYDTNIVGSIQHFAQTRPRQLFEIRYCPLLAILLLTASWLVLRFKRTEPVALAKVLFAAAMGPLSFGLMRLFLFAAYREDLAWFIFWEEATELLFVVAVAFVLLIFRQSLFAAESTVDAALPGKSSVRG